MLFGWKQSTLHVMQAIGSIDTGYWKILHMSYWFEEIQILYILLLGNKCYILKKVTRLRKFKKKCDESLILRYSTLSKAYRVFNKTSGIVE